MIQKLLLGLLLWPTLVPAQGRNMITVGEVPKRVEKPQKPAPYQKSRRTQEGRREAQMGYGKNSLLVGMVSFMGGNTPVLYERTLTGPLTLQVGAGVTSRSFTSLYGETMLTGEKKEGRIFDRNGGVNINDEYSDYDNRSAVPGWSFSLSPRVYIKGDDALDGRFVGFLAEHRTYRWKAQMLDVMVPVTPREHSQDFTQNTQLETQQSTDLSFVFGRHEQYVKHIAMGYVFGIGMRLSKSVRQDLGYYRNAGGEDHYANETVEFTNRRLLITIQVNVGGWW